MQAEFKEYSEDELGLSEKQFSDNQVKREKETERYVGQISATERAKQLDFYVVFDSGMQRQEGLRWLKSQHDVEKEVFRFMNSSITPDPQQTENGFHLSFSKNVPRAKELLEEFFKSHDVDVENKDRVKLGEVKIYLVIDGQPVKEHQAPETRQAA